MKERGELERERDTLRMESNMLKNKIAIQENNMQDLKSSVEEKVCKNWTQNKIKFNSKTGEYQFNYVKKIFCCCHRRA